MQILFQAGKTLLRILVVYFLEMLTVADSGCIIHSPILRLYILVHALGEGRIQLAICVKMCIRRTEQGQRRRGKKMARPDEKERIKTLYETRADQEKK